MAHLIDLLAVAGLCFGILVLIGMTIQRADTEFATGVSLFVVSFVPFAYFIMQEGLWNGQTIGKRLSGVRVRMADGTPITFAAAIGRNVLRPADMLPGPYFVGLLAIFTNPKSQRLGDLVSNTIVTHEQRVSRIEIAAPHAAGIHPLEQHVGELRGMTIEEYNTLRRYCDRFPELSPETQVKLTTEIWEPIAERRKILVVPNVHPIYLAEAVVMKYGRQHGLL